MHLASLAVLKLDMLVRRDIKGYSKSNSVLEPVRIYRGHSSVVEDVAWHTDSDNIFASVGDDKMLMLWV